MGDRGSGPSRVTPPAEIRAPSRARGATRAAIGFATEARSRPGGGRGLLALATETAWSGEPQVLLVLGSAWHAGQQWLRVRLPARPDGSAGWIPRNTVSLLAAPYWIEVETARRTVAVYRHGRLVRAFPAVVGKPSTPTPTGLAAVYEIDRQPESNGFLGTWALPLTLYSHTLLSFGGGSGQIAIHGRGGASLLDPLGSARSHGCIRIDDSAVDWLAHHVTQGTPVQIVD